MTLPAPSSDRFTHSDDSVPAQKLTIQLEALQSLYERIISRKGIDPRKSYTAQLLAGGVDVACAKIAEEARELIDAAHDESAQAVVHEAADLIYHIEVLLAARDINFAAVLEVLREREAQSGLAEKAARQKNT